MIREEWIASYKRELASGKFGQVISVWFDDPFDFDHPWEPCAITLKDRGGKKIFSVIVEEIMNNSLKEYARYTRIEPAFLQVKRLRPWNLSATWGEDPSSDAWMQMSRDYEICRCSYMLSDERKLGICYACNFDGFTTK